MYVLYIYYSRLESIWLQKCSHCLVTDLDTLCIERLMQIIRAAAVSQGRPRQLWAILLVKGFRRQSHDPSKMTTDVTMISDFVR